MPRPRSRAGRWPGPRAGKLDVACPAPTATPGYFFHLTLHGAWEELPSPHPHHSPAAVATDHALAIARNITAGYLATDTVTAAARINTVLGRPIDIPRQPVRLAWAAVHLTAHSDAVQAAVSHQRRLYEEEQRRTEHNHRLEQAQTLRDTLMSDPSLALAYWFATAPETVDTHTLGRLEELLVKTAVYAPQGRWAPLARLLHTFALGLTDDAKNHLAATLAVVIDRYGHPGIAAAIQELWQTPETSEAHVPPK
ncbi:hypothetical protein ACIQB5_46435 [Streptomyces sp. NPDC088560]|uniref:hypothetical protein n=1 Tax=Streptomyces sp. NPDC088560 TaxID=3365868 RepID=UPI00381671A7